MKEYPDFVTSTGYGTVEGLKGANCYHDFYPFIPGISIRSYTDAELEQLNKEDNTPQYWGGKPYTKYEALQRQRLLERRMRKYEEQEYLLGLGGADEQSITAVRARYRAVSGEYAAFSKKMKLPEQRSRTRTGYGIHGGGGDFSTPEERMRELGVDFSDVDKNDFQTIPGKAEHAVANMEYINSHAYADKFSGKYENAEVESAVVSACRQLIKNRNGTNFEEAFFIDAKTGRTISYVKGKREHGVEMPDYLKKLLTTSKEKSIIMIHNHPNSSTFSAADYITSAKYSSCYEALACGHNGEVYCFRNTAKTLGTYSETRGYDAIREFHIAYEKYCHSFHDFEARHMAWKSVSKNRGFIYEKR